MEKLSAKQLKQKYSQGVRDFSDKNFSGENLSGFSLINADFTGCDFTGCRIRETDFSNSNFYGAKLNGVVAGLSWLKQFQSTIIIYLFIFFLGLVSGVGGFVLESIGSPDLLKKGFIPAILIFILLEVFSFSLIKKSVETVKKSKILQFDTNQNSLRFDNLYSVLSVLIIFSFLCLLLSLNFVIKEIIGFFWLTIAFAVLSIGGSSQDEVIIKTYQTKQDRKRIRIFSKFIKP